LKIKLRKLPDSRNVTMNIALSAELKARIDRYAAFYAQTWTEQIDARTLIPHILSQFLATDRAFQKLEHARTLTLHEVSNQLLGDHGSDSS
jgi:hypothetical protein